MNRGIKALVVASASLIGIFGCISSGQAAQFGLSSTASSVLVEKVGHFSQSVPLREINNPSLSPLLRRAIGNRVLTKHQVELLRQGLIKNGYLPRSGHKFIVPLRRKLPAMSQAPQVQDRDLQKSSLGSARARSMISSSLTVSPIVNFDGLGQSTNHIPQVAPPDTDIAVGLNDVVEVVNSAYGSLFQVYDKTGAAKG